MASVNSRNGKLNIDFRYHGIRCREMTTLKDNKANRKRMAQFLKQLEIDMHSAKFRYEKYFPKSKRIDKIRALEKQAFTLDTVILFKNFAEVWLSEKQPEWRESHQEYMRDVFRLYLNPEFGEKPVNINKADIMAFRAGLSTQNQFGKTLSASRINHIMSPLRNVLMETSDRFSFESPWRNIKPLPIPKSDIHPFTLDEVMSIINTVRADYKAYYTVRFFTALRTGEIDGLTWSKIDFQRRQIIVDQSYKDGKIGPTKTRSSIRTVDMSQLVYDTLKAHEAIHNKKSNHVFCTPDRKPMDCRAVTKKVWYPLLSLIEIEKRRPYHSRHTTATLWLAAGESPEWIAK